MGLILKLKIPDLKAEILRFKVEKTGLRKKAIFGKISPIVKTQTIFVCLRVHYKNPFDRLKIRPSVWILVLHKRGLCSRIAGWGGEKRQGVGWGTDKLTSGRSRRSTGHKVHKKHGTPMKNYGGGWVGCVVSLPCYHPSDLSLRLTSLSLSLNLLFPPTLRNHSMITQHYCLKGRFAAL